jgi:hypothetical protein
MGCVGMEVFRTSFFANTIPSGWEPYFEQQFYRCIVLIVPAFNLHLSLVQE